MLPELVTYHHVVGEHEGLASLQATPEKVYQNGPVAAKFPGGCLNPKGFTVGCAVGLEQKSCDLCYERQKIENEVWEA